TIGFGDSSMAFSSGWNTFATADVPARSLSNSLMSAPPQKALPAPVNTIARTAGSAERASNAARMPSRTPGLRAFTGGLLSVITPTSPSRDRVTRSLIFKALLPPPSRGRVRVGVSESPPTLTLPREGGGDKKSAAQLKQPRRPLAAADAHGDDAVAGLSPLHL